MVCYYFAVIDIAIALVKALRRTESKALYECCWNSISSLTGVTAGYLCLGEFLHDDVIVFAKSHCHVTSGSKMSLMDAAAAADDARDSRRHIMIEKYHHHIVSILS
jgi:hypothetical protein